MKTRAQVWSRIAHECVSAQATKSGDARQNTAKYKTSCMRMPGLIHQSGALQALVFQLARTESGAMYVDHLAQAYFADPKKFPDAKKSGQGLVEHAQALDLKPYMALTRDLSDIAQWFRRFAQIELAGVEE